MYNCARERDPISYSAPPFDNELDLGDGHASVTCLGMCGVGPSRYGVVATADSSLRLKLS